MLNVSFNIVTSDYSNVTKVNPSGGDDSGVIHLGLIGQLHYVGLDRVVSEQSVDNDELIYNENIHDGDDYVRQITGAPLENCMSLIKYFQ